MTSTGYVTEQMHFAALCADKTEQDRIAEVQFSNQKMYVMVLGQSGAGKSTTINNLLRNKVGADAAATPYKAAGGDSVTKVPQLFSGHLYDTPCGIIDQAGFGDTDGLSDAATLGNALIYVATKVPNQRVDGFLIVQSLREQRSYIKRNCEVIKNVFGEKALERTVVFVTSAEALYSKDEEIQEEAQAKFNGYKDEAKKHGMRHTESQVVPFYNSIVDKRQQPNIMMALGFKEGQHELYLPYMRRKYQYLLMDFQVSARSDTKPAEIKEIYDDVVLRCKEKLGAKLETKVVHGATTELVVRRAAYTETYYDPSVGSIAGSIFSLGISAACGANQSTRLIPADTYYPAKEKEIDFTFPDVGETFGITVKDASGDGQVQVLSQDAKRVHLKLFTNGPQTPTVKIQQLICKQENDKDMENEVLQYFQSNSIVKEGNKERFPTIAELKERFETYIKNVKNV